MAGICAAVSATNSASAIRFWASRKFTYRKTASGEYGHKRPRLTKGKIRLRAHALLFRRIGRMIHAPGVKPGLGTPQLGKHLVRVGVLNETRVASETGEILFSKSLFGKGGHLLNRGVVVQPVANHRRQHILSNNHGPADNFIGQLRQRLPVDFHDQSVRFEIRIHPVERKTFLDIKFAVGILVENGFR